VKLKIELYRFDHKRSCFAKHWHLTRNIESLRNSKFILSHFVL